MNWKYFILSSHLLVPLKKQQQQQQNQNQMTKFVDSIMKTFLIILIWRLIYWKVVIFINVHE